MKPIVLLDVDGVVADFHTAVRDFAQGLLDRELPAATSSYEIEVSMGLDEQETRRFWQAARLIDWAHSISIYSDAIDGIEQLREVADVAFVTSPWRGNKTWCHHRYELLNDYFPGVDLIQTSAKHRVLGDFLVDDRLATLERGGNWYGLLWSKHHGYNANATGGSNWARVDGWDDVIRKVTR